MCRPIAVICAAGWIWGNSGAILAAGLLLALFIVMMATKGWLED